MHRLSHRDWQTLEACLVAFYGPGLDSTTFLPRAFALLDEVIPSCLVAYGEMTNDDRSIAISLSKENPGAVPGLTAFARLMAPYALFNWNPAVNNGQPFHRGDFFSRRQFRSLDIFSETFRVMDIDDHFAIHLPSESGRTIFFGIERSGNTAFSERDRTVARLAQSHLANARYAVLKSAGLCHVGYDASVARLHRAGLTHRESEVCHWLIEGKTNAEIAVILGMRETTVKTHVTSIFSRAAVENRAAALRWGLEVLSRPELVVPMQQTVTAHFAEE